MRITNACRWTLARRPIGRLGAPPARNTGPRCDARLGAWARHRRASLDPRRDAQLCAWARHRRATPDPGATLDWAPGRATGAPLRATPNLPT
ncbi:MAG: hypothetical protein NZM94_15135 [Roseiflexus sp.]|nr:hypothetical protein [Roseiflexus sp.]